MFGKILFLCIKLNNFSTIFFFSTNLQSPLLIYTQQTSLKYKNTRNNNGNIFIVLGAFKSLLFSHLDIDVHDVLNYRTNYLLRKCPKKCSRDLIGLFEHAPFDCNISWDCNKIWVRVKNSVGFIRNFYEKDVYHVTKDFHLCGWLLSHDLSKFWAKLVISLKHNFCKIPWDIVIL